MRIPPQVITLRGIFIVPLPGVWVTRSACLAAAKWAKLYGVHILHVCTKPSLQDGLLGYEVKVTVPEDTFVPNFKNPRGFFKQETARA